MIIKSCIKDYTVNREPNLDFFMKIKDKNNYIMVIDKNVYKIYGDTLFKDVATSSLFLFDALEENKTIATVLQIAELYTKIPAKRNALMISIGGGIVQDVTGFVANILYRGIKWIFIPTTLLASCDSCIGSKTSLNYKQYKNLLGTFYPPDEIYICSEFFKTLSDDDFKSGLGEVVKFCVMEGPSGIDLIERNIDLLLKRDTEVLNDFVGRSLRFKKSYIENDEFDKGERIYLNFAHTFGHAFETVSAYRIPHGLAVAMGMLLANRISLQRGYLSSDIVERVENIVKRILTIKINPQSFKLPPIIEAIRQDKKQVDNSLSAVLLFGDMKINVFHDIQITEISDALGYILSLLNAE